MSAPPMMLPLRRKPLMSERFSRLLLPNAFDPCAVRVLSRGGQEKLRTHVTVRRSRNFVDGADIVIRQRLKRGNRKKGGPLRSRPSFPRMLQDIRENCEQTI